MDDPKIFRLHEHRAGRRRAAARKRARAEQLEALAEGVFQAGQEDRYDGMMDRVDAIREAAEELER